MNKPTNPKDALGVKKVPFSTVPTPAHPSLTQQRMYPTSVLNPPSVSYPTSVLNPPSLSYPTSVLNR